MEMQQKNNEMELETQRKLVEIKRLEDCLKEKSQAYDYLMQEYHEYVLGYLDLCFHLYLYV